jgi:hypothetical protein
MGETNHKPRCRMSKFRQHLEKRRIPVLMQTYGLRCIGDVQKLCIQLCYAQLRRSDLCKGGTGGERATTVLARYWLLASDRR